MKVEKVYCLFEQSGIFKNEFKKLGIEAFDYDLQNVFGETDRVLDLFGEIERAYTGERSVFDNMETGEQGGLLFAFFPCTYFCENNCLYFMGTHINLQGRPQEERERIIIERAEERHRLYVLLLKLFAVCTKKGLRLIVENPYSANHYLYNNIPYKPQVIDTDRTRRGDFYPKPTQYYFHNCEPTRGLTIVKNRKEKRVAKGNPSGRGGKCSAERSMISTDYARNFICDFVLGKPQAYSVLTMEFEEET